LVIGARTIDAPGPAHLIGCPVKIGEVGSRADWG